MCWASHSMAQTWNWLDQLAPSDESDWLVLSQVQSPPFGVQTLASTLFACLDVSILPDCGQAVPSPRIQKAGQLPWRVSMRARISNRPYCQACLPDVVIEVDV